MKKVKEKKIEEKTTNKKDIFIIKKRKNIMWVIKGKSEAKTVEG